MRYNTPEHPFNGLFPIYLAIIINYLLFLHFVVFQLPTRTTRSTVTWRRNASHVSSACTRVVLPRGGCSTVPHRPRALGPIRTTRTAPTQVLDSWHVIHVVFYIFLVAYNYNYKLKKSSISLLILFVEFHYSNSCSIPSILSNAISA